MNPPPTHPNPRPFHNAVAIVTGAGSGVGAAVCAQLARAGATIALVGRNAAKLRTVRQSLPKATATHLIAGDIGDSTFCRRVATTTLATLGAPTLLVNNAGVIRRGTATATDDTAWREVMRTNVDGVFYLSRETLSVMQDGGAIVNTASTCGLVGAAGLTAYCASKGAVIQLTRAMAIDCASRRITVNAVCPGAIDAPMLYAAHPKKDANDANTPAAIRDRNVSAIPLEKIATAQEVARAILYLASEPHITGATLAIDGGYTAR